MKKTQLNITREEALNLITYAEYLKDLLATADVSDDFAPDPNTCVTGWDLLTDNAAWKAIEAIARGE